jgi:MinD superfamily P-loop ATPase
MVPVINVYKCEGCGTCLKNCPPQIIGFVKKKAAMLVQLCEECGICVDVCPVKAIDFKLPTVAGDHVHEGYRTHQ